METVIRKWGNSPALRFSAATMKLANFDLEQRVTIKAGKGRIIIEPVRVPAFDLASLVAGITDENRHAEIESGGPVGNEIL